MQLTVEWDFLLCLTQAYLFGFYVTLKKFIGP